jgi:hypothetical protein
MNISSALPQPLTAPAPFGACWFLPGDGAEDPSSPKISQFGSTAPREDLPYRVELWDERKTSVEQILAVTANGSIGYAAYYEAVREYPNRYVTLRHKNSIVSRSNPPEN